MAVAHRVSHPVGVEDGAAFDVAGAAADGLDQRGGAAEIAFFVGVENGDQGNFGKVEAFAEEIDADEDVEFAAAKIAKDADALEGIDFRVQVAAADADFGEIFGEVFGHAFGERGDQDALVALGANANFFEQIVYLAFDGADFSFGVDQARGTNDLLDDRRRRLCVSS